MQHPAPLLACCVLLLAGAAGAATDGPNASSSELGQAWAVWFQPQTTLKPMDGAAFPVFAVVSPAGNTNGWVFRTDRVPPVVRGKRGEIGVLVGVGTDGRIKGIAVLQQHEDAAWFNRLKAGFYAQFSNRPADGSSPHVDTVATATVSSKAIIEDVFTACRAVFELPAVHSQLTTAPALPGPAATPAAQAPAAARP